MIIFRASHNHINISLYHSSKISEKSLQSVRCFVYCVIATATRKVCAALSVLTKFFVRPKNPPRPGSYDPKWILRDKAMRILSLDKLRKSLKTSVNSSRLKSERMKASVRVKLKQIQPTKGSDDIRDALFK